MARSTTYTRMPLPIEALDVEVAELARSVHPDSMKHLIPPMLDRRNNLEAVKAALAERKELQRLLDQERKHSAILRAQIDGQTVLINEAIQPSESAGQGPQPMPQDHIPHVASAMIKCQQRSNAALSEMVTQLAHEVQRLRHEAKTESILTDILELQQEKVLEHQEIMKSVFDAMLESTEHRERRFIQKALREYHLVAEASSAGFELPPSEQLIRTLREQVRTRISHASSITGASSLASFCSHQKPSCMLRRSATAVFITRPQCKDLGARYSSPLNHHHHQAPP